jgi:hypothetical protein
MELKGKQAAAAAAAATTTTTTTKTKIIPLIIAATRVIPKCLFDSLKILDLSKIFT